MKKLFIFDFDGTLFDSVEDVIICFNKALQKHDLPTLTREEYLKCLGGNIDEITSLVLGDNLTDENLENVKTTYLSLYNPSKKEKTIPFPKTHDLLKKLQSDGILLAINSNRLNYSLKEFIDKFFSDIDFVGIEGHNDDNPSKPDPYGVNSIVKKANVSKDDAVYIGDSQTDIKTAKNAGIDCIVVKWGYGNADDYDDEYILEAIDDVDELLKYAS